MARLHDKHTRQPSPILPTPPYHLSSHHRTPEPPNAYTLPPTPYTRHPTPYTLHPYPPMSNLPAKQPTQLLPEMPAGARAGVCGLILPDGLTQEEWAAIAPRFRLIYSMTQWHLGDWLRYGERKWGRMYAGCGGGTGRRGETLRDAGRGAKGV